MSKEQVQELIDAGVLVSLAVTGGGTQVISEILRHGGASSFFLSADVPYHAKAWKDLETHFYHAPDKFVTVEAAKFLADVMLDKALMLTKEDGGLWPDNQQHLGIGATSKLAYDGERPGREHTICIGVESILDKRQTDISYVQEYQIPEHLTSREDQEKWCSDLIMATLVMGCKGTLKEGTRVDV